MADESTIANPIRSEMPPDRHFELGWATPDQQRDLIGQLRSMGRQTMNLRTSSTAKMLLMRSLQTSHVVGWGGVDKDRDPAHPELFSLHVDPPYRTYTLGLVLELARYTYLLMHGISRAYARMDAKSNYSLLRYRVSNGLYVPVPPGTDHQTWMTMCNGCDLRGIGCLEQMFFSIDVAHFVERGNARIGRIDVGGFPSLFELRPNMVRQQARDQNDERQPYRPYWV